MRRLLLATLVTGFLTGAAGSALAAPDLPKVPQNCHEWNELLHIQNVRDCEDPTS